MMLTVDINTLRGISTILVMLVFVGICWWAFSPKRKQKFKEAAQIPFEDEPQQEVSEGKMNQKEMGNK